MKNRLLSFTILVFIAFSAVSCSQNPGTSVNQAPKALSDNELIQRGEYLVTTIGCNDCHSPKRMTERGPEVIPELRLSGYPGNRPVQKANSEALKEGWGLLNYDLTSFVGPWGESFAANITPDETGIGTWTEEQFKKALTQGKFKGIDGSRMLLPPMPWQSWTSMKDEDVRAIYLYLKSLPPVRNIVPAPIPPDQLAAHK